MSYAAVSRRAAALSCSLWLLLGLGLLAPTAVRAGPIHLDALAVEDYLLIGTGSSIVISISVDVSNHELGANTDPLGVPMSGLVGATEFPLPDVSDPGYSATALPVATGISGDGDTAIVNDFGTFSFSNVEVWGQRGVDCFNVNLGACISNISQSDFNGSVMNPANGVNADVDLSGVLSDLATAAVVINAAAPDVIFNFITDGIWTSTDENDVEAHDISLGSGLTMFDFVTGANDLSLNNSQILINGPSDAFAIFRIPNTSNFNVSNSNIVVGDGGIGLNNVLFFTDKNDNNQHIDIDDAIINGVAFWDMTENMDGEVNWNNVQGCTQVVGGKINMNDVRLTNCGFSPGIVTPEPSAAALVLAGLLLLGLVSRPALSS